MLCLTKLSLCPPPRTAPRLPNHWPRGRVWLEGPPTARPSLRERRDSTLQKEITAGGPDSPALRVRRDEGRLATRPRDASTPALSSAGHPPDSPSRQSTQLAEQEGCDFLSIMRKMQQKLRYLPKQELPSPAGEGLPQASRAYSAQHSA